MILFFLMLMNQADAATVLMAAPGAAEVEYQAQLRAHPDYISPTKSYLATHPTAAHRERLLTALTSAQKSFVQNSTAEAKAGFMGVLGLLHEDDWKREDLEVFLLAYFRLAQLEGELDPGARDRWLALSLLLGPGLSANESLIPPPLVTRRRELSEQVPTAPIGRTNLASGWSEILINGQRCLQRECETWARYPGKVRITFLSDRWLPQTLIVEASDIGSTNPKTVAWAEGSCTSPRPHAQAVSGGKIFWNPECDRPKMAEENFKPVPAPAAGLIPMNTSSSKSTPVLRSKWFWASVGLVAAVILVKQAQKRESVETTTTYGY